MKGIILNEPRREYIPYEEKVTIHEYRSPTDESVKLLNEMQEKALNNIVKSINVNDNTINAAVIYVFNAMSSIYDEIVYRVKFTFNGKEYNLEGKIPRQDLDSSKYGSQAVYVAIAKALCILIAENVMKEIPDLSKQFMWR